MRDLRGGEDGDSWREGFRGISIVDHVTHVYHVHHVYTIPYHVHITRLRGVFTSLRLCIMQRFYLSYKLLLTRIHRRTRPTPIRYRHSLLSVQLKQS